MSELILCPVCHRHVKRVDAACPFCRSTMRGAAGIAAMAVLTTGMALVACSNDTGVYGGAPYGGEGGMVNGGSGGTGGDAIGGTGGIGGSNTGGGAVAAYGPPPPTDAGTD